MVASILVVEDEPSMRELLALHLRNAGYEVHTAADGLEGGYAVLHKQPDLIISDVNMPHMDGFAFIAAIRGEAAMRSIPVIFLTTFEEGQHRGKELGAVDYLPKPVRADKLLGLVAQHVSGGRHPIG